MPTPNQLKGQMNRELGDFGETVGAELLSPLRFKVTPFRRGQQCFDYFYEQDGRR
jgi:hypothetical protein